MKLSVFLCIALVLMASSTSRTENRWKGSQEKSTDFTLSNCEANAATLDAVHQMAGDDGVIIAVARLGDGERNRSLSRRRLQILKSYLTNAPWTRPRETVVVAEGERVKGYGRIELYVGGKRVHVLPIKRNRAFLVQSCGK